MAFNIFGFITKKILLVLINPESVQIQNFLSKLILHLSFSLTFDILPKQNEKNIFVSYQVFIWSYEVTKKLRCSTLHKAEHNSLDIVGFNSQATLIQLSKINKINLHDSVFSDQFKKRLFKKGGKYHIKLHKPMIDKGGS